MTANVYATRNQVPSPADSSDTGLPIRGLAGLLAGWLEQTAVRLRGHGGPRPAPHMMPRTRSQPTARAGHKTGFRRAAVAPVKHGCTSSPGKQTTKANRAYIASGLRQECCGTSAGASDESGRNGFAGLGLFGLPPFQGVLPQAV
jgi:hypothetical protein